MRNLMLVCAGVALVSGVVSVNLWRELRAERAISAELRERVAAADGRLSGVMPFAPALPVGTPAPAPATVAASAGATEAAKPAARAAAAFNPINLNERDMLKDPEYRKARLAQSRMSLPQNYPGLAEELGLSVEETDKLFDMLAQHQLESAEHAIWSGTGQPDQAAMQEQMKAMTEVSQRQQGELSSLLGGKYPQWQEYQQSQPARMRVTQLRRTLEASGQPLSDVQARPLVAAMVSEQNRQRQDAQAFMRDSALQGPQAQERMQEENFRRQTESNRRLVAAAEPHLSASQLETYKSMLDSQLAMSRAFSRAQREQGGVPVPGETPPPTRIIMVSP